MIDKVLGSFKEAVADVHDGSVILIGGFGPSNGTPSFLIRALVEQGAKNLTIVANTPGMGRSAPGPAPGRSNPAPPCARGSARGATGSRPGSRRRTAPTGARSPPARARAGPSHDGTRVATPPA